MNITPIKESVDNTSKRVLNAGKHGYKVGLRTNKIYKQNRASKLYNLSKSVTKQVAKETTVDNLPYVAGAVGLILPVVGASPVMLALGFIAKYIIKSMKK